MAPPDAVIQVELAELDQVAATQLKATACHGCPEGLKLPFQR
jgi:hypothetical protein